MEDFQLTYGQNAVSEKIPPCKVVSVTGHRDLESRFSVASLQNLFDRLVAAGADTFCIGMARGFDLLCGRLLCEMKERIPLKLVACIPCADQSDGFRPRNKSGAAGKGLDLSAYARAGLKIRVHQRRCLMKLFFFIVAYRDPKHWGPPFENRERILRIQHQILRDHPIFLQLFVQ